MLFAELAGLTGAFWRLAAVEQRARDKLLGGLG
jgi:hypothetical protein